MFIKFSLSLFSQDGVLLALKDWGVPEEGYVPADTDDPYLVVHPNYDVHDQWDCKNVKQTFHVAF